MTHNEIMAEFRQLVLHADLHYRVWRVYSGEPQHHDVVVAMPYQLFFQASREAHLGQAIILTYQLFHVPPIQKYATTTLSAYRVLAVVGESVSPEVRAVIDAEISAAQDVHGKLDLLRNKFVAHRDLSFSDPDFEKAGLTPGDLKAQIEVGKRIHNFLGEALNTGEYSFGLDVDASLRCVLDSLMHGTPGVSSSSRPGQGER